MHSPTALAAPVAEGMILHAAARPPRQSLAEGPSTVFCVAVYEWMVVINPFSMPIPDLRMTCSRSDVALCLLSIDKQTSGLNDILNTHCSPWQLLQAFTARSNAFDLVAIDNQCVGTLGGDIMFELAVRRVVLHLVLEVLGIGGHVHNTYNIECRTQEALIANRLEDHASDATETIDANLDGHCNKIERHSWEGSSQPHSFDG